MIEQFHSTGYFHSVISGTTVPYKFARPSARDLCPIAPWEPTCYNHTTCPGTFVFDKIIEYWWACSRFLYMMVHPPYIEIEIIARKSFCRWWLNPARGQMYGSSSIFLPPKHLTLWKEGVDFLHLCKWLWNICGHVNDVVGMIFQPNGNNILHSADDPFFPDLPRAFPAPTTGNIFPGRSSQGHWERHGNRLRKWDWESSGLHLCSTSYAVHPANTPCLFFTLFYLLLIILFIWGGGDVLGILLGVMPGLLYAMMRFCILHVMMALSPGSIMLLCYGLGPFPIWVSLTDFFFS
jgi:hypothetical protein